VVHLSSYIAIPYPTFPSTTLVLHPSTACTTFFLPASLSFLNAAEISLVEKQYHAKTTSAFINVRLLAVRNTLIASLCSMS
jgi:hypothetical protein